MNTNYKTSKDLSPDNYNKLSSESIKQLCKTLITYMPFSPCRCALTYNKNSEIHTIDISTLPQNFFASSTTYFSLDFTHDNDNFIIITFTPTAISISSYLPHDYPSTKEIIESIFNVIDNFLKEELGDSLTILQAPKHIATDAEDDAYCQKLYDEYKKDTQANNSENMNIEDFTKELEIDLK